MKYTADITNASGAWVPEQLQSNNIKELRKQVAKSFGKGWTVTLSKNYYDEEGQKIDEQFLIRYKTRA